MLYHIAKDYFKYLSKQSEFITDINRVYFLIRNLKYKGKNIDIAIPLRANINQSFQRKPEEFIATPPTPHTRPNNIAGWHITKLVPIDSRHLTPVHGNRKDYKTAESTAKIYLDEMKSHARVMLNKLETGEIVFGAINIDNALAALETLKSSQIKNTRKNNVDFNKYSQSQLIAIKHGFSPNAAKAALRDIAEEKTTAPHTKLSAIITKDTDNKTK